MGPSNRINPPKEETMPTYVRTEKCDGCKGQDKTACMYIYPHDLMALDRDGSVTGHAMRAYNQEPEQCWECYSCVKICPQNAIEVRRYADIVPLGGSVQPLRGSDSIMWTIRFRNGTMKRFKFPIRTTSEGSIPIPARSSRGSVRAPRRSRRSSSAGARRSTDAR
jgi:adenylylsulfate reductase subunit B